jgi:hypothetical protein
LANGLVEPVCPVVGLSVMLNLPPHQLGQIQASQKVCDYLTNTAWFKNFCSTMI